jgi:RNA binding exosome subunit
MPEEVTRFSSAEIRLVIHATEDLDKVLNAVEGALAVPQASFQSEKSEGHYGNQILLVGAEVGSRDAALLATRIISTLNRADRQELADNIEDYADEKGSLYLRLDKQRLCQGKVSLAESDAVRIKFKPIRRYKPSGNMEAYRGLLSSIE